jgi:hypothetical protein
MVLSILLFLFFDFRTSAQVARLIILSKYKVKAEASDNKYSTGKKIKIKKIFTLATFFKNHL